MTTEPRSPEFLEGFRAYRPGDTLMHCPFGGWLVGDIPSKEPEQFKGWYTAWEEYQDHMRANAE